ncbi:LIC_13215 family putative lipoprotein [Leptospira yasudae]|uniref:Lipoprotein n=2 Tax=Leptospira yasudae TaxID=2202201 RepID=A0A7I0IL56_9LEPT|nr:hypothetical protein [Leptospira yasudae]TGL78300.1 hypothetical protein EHQ77_12130 [Leptospira yasudae]TGL80992.1 hypothetical protein EHQ83_15930 [Leptospira yasudae]
MKKNPIRIVATLLVFAFVILNCKKEHALDPNAKVVQISSLGLGLNYEGWHFNDNPNLINQAKEVAANSDNTGTIKKALDVAGINFFLFEFPQGSPEAGMFNTNVNYTMEDLSRQPREISLDDYTSAVTGLYPTVFQKYEMINPPQKSKIHGIESVLLESRFEQAIAGKNFKVHNYQRVFIVDKKAHVFTGTFLDKDAKTKGPKVLELLGKFEKL